jgi:hypothetical protein
LGVNQVLSGASLENHVKRFMFELQVIQSLVLWFANTHIAATNQSFLVVIDWRWADELTRNTQEE